MMSAFTPTVMDSANIDNTFKQVLENTMTEFATITREIRKSKAAILQAEYRLNLCQKRLRSAVTSLKDDVNIVLALQCNDEAGDSIIANADIEPQASTSKRHDAKHEANNCDIAIADKEPRTSTPTRHDVQPTNMNDSGLELSRADADEDDDDRIPQRRSTRKRTHAFLDF